MATSRYNTASAGSAVSGLASGGYTTTVVVTTEEWTVPSTATNKTITD